MLLDGFLGLINAPPAPVRTRTPTTAVHIALEPPHGFAPALGVLDCDFPARDPHTTGADAKSIKDIM